MSGWEIVAGVIAWLCAASSLFCAFVAWRMAGRMREADEVLRVVGALDTVRELDERIHRARLILAGGDNHAVAGVYTIERRGGRRG